MGERIVRLEACRGIAALVVALSHTLLAFEPTIADTLSGTIYYTIINGRGAVVFFFALSGYVLTIKFFENPDPNLIARAVFKRLPRLACLTTVVTVISALIWLSGLYYYRPAAALSGSGWLASFAGADLPADFVPTITGAIAQGGWETFITGDSSLDTSLWSMKHELYGSFLVFFAAPFFVYVLRGKFVWLLLLLGAAIFKYSDNYMIAFLCGLGIAYSQGSMTLPRSPWLTSALLVIGLYLLGFSSSDRHYSVFSFLPPDYKIAILSIGAAAVICAVLRSPRAEKILGNEIGALLGRLSFPIYLVQVPVICSVSSLAYLTAFPSLGRAAIYPAALCTVIITLAVALPLAKLDVAWVRFLNSKLTLRPALAPMAAE
jgi:peptidoglycan/LPS O-acetylase OafA/YrhL